MNEANTYTSAINCPSLKFCFGCEALGGTDWGNVDIFQLEEAIRLAMSLRINFFDVADVYGLGAAEENLSTILAEYRHEAFIATKIGVKWNQPSKLTDRAQTSIDNSPLYLDRAIKASLKRLRVGYLHWPIKDNVVFATGVERLSYYKRMGIIKYMGLSNVNLTQLQIASSIAQIDFIQLPANILDTEIDLEILQHCKKNNIKIVTYNVLASGLLTGKYSINSSFTNNDRRSRLANFQQHEIFKNKLNQVEYLQTQASTCSLTLSQYSIKSLLQKYIENDLYIITGIKNSQQLLENFSAISNSDAPGG
jgi:aryl-alcohol dehydrogenase-like predicted oxidoreductase